MSHKSRSRVGRAIGWAVAAAAVLYVGMALAFGDGRKVATLLADFPAVPLVLGLLCAAVNYGLRFAKWQVYLLRLGIATFPRRPPPTTTATRPPTTPAPAPYVGLVDSLLIFVGGFALTVTPGKIGEVLKAYLLRESHGVPMARTAPIVLAERLTDLLALILLSLLGVGAWLSAEQRSFLAVGAGLCVATVALLSWRRAAHFVFDRLAALFPESRLVRSLLATARPLYDSAYELLRPWPLLVTTILSLLAWASECLTCYLIVHAIPGGESASLLLCTFVYSLMTVVGALSFVPGGLLVTEGGMTALFVRLGGMPEPSALSATLLVRTLTLWFAVLLGALSLWLFGRRQHGLRLDVDLAAMHKPDGRQ